MGDKYEDPHHHRYSISLVTRKIQIKTIIRYIYTLLLCLDFLKTLTTPTMGKNVEQPELLYLADRNTKWHNHLQKQGNILL